MADGKIKVSVEKTIHNAIAETLQKIYDEHGVCVKNIEAEWLDRRIVGKDRMFLCAVELKTYSRVGQ